VTVDLSGVHHVTIPVTDLHASVAWYETCLAAERIARFDHHADDGTVFAMVLRLPGKGPLLELRTSPAVASAVAGYTPITLGVADRDELDRWASYLDANGIPHSQVTTRRIGESIQIESPEGLVLCLYTQPTAGVEAVPFSEGVRP
jgi:catechol 2,3-dioxygenase-like lactoylglutathione lyase family enzyme